MKRWLSAIGLAILSFGFSATSSLSADLTITGSDGSQLATFDQASLEALGMKSIQTVTPWTDGVVDFQGPTVNSVLMDAGIAGKAVIALAFDDYAVSLSPKMVSAYDPIIATRINGERMTIDNNGPLWIIFDFDSACNDTADELRSLAVWHLIELEVE